MQTFVVTSLAALLAIAPRCVWAQPATSAAPPPVQRTTVVGTAPSLDGRWLLSMRLGAASSGANVVAALWDVHGNGAVEVVDRLALLPDAQRALVTKGRSELSQADLRAIAQAWDNLAPDGRGVREVQTDVFGEDGFTAELKGDPATAGASWVVRQTHLFAPGSTRPLRQVTILAATGIDRGVWNGRYVSVTLAAAPLPIPIRVEGTFQLIPLPSSSWWARLLDVFRGCNAGGPGDP